MKFWEFSKDVILCFKSYLSNRKFKVSVGPHLFLLYINEMPQAVKCEPLLYADDTYLIFQA